MSTTDINLAEQVEGILPVANGGTGNTSNAAASCTGNAATATTAGGCSGNSATATKLATARTIQTNLASTSSASFDGSANAAPGVTGTLPVANGGTGNTTNAAASCTGNAATATTASACSGNSATATTLATARTVQTNLGSTSAASFDGSANIAPGITGTLPVAHGGTGNTTNAAASCSGNAATATKLATARAINVSLSVNAVSGDTFDGSSAVTVGIFSTLNIANGGTGASTASAALSNLGGVAASGSATGMWVGPSSSLPSTGTTGVLYVCTS